MCVKVNMYAMISPLLVGATVIGNRVTGALDGCLEPPLWKKTSRHLHVCSELQANIGTMHTHIHMHTHITYITVENMRDEREK